MAKCLNKGNVTIAQWPTKLNFSSVSINKIPTWNRVIISSKNETLFNQVIAEAYFEDTYLEYGWYFLEVWTNGVFPDNEQAFWGGYVEGCVNTKIISQHFNNTKIPETTGNKTKQFIDENLEWLQKEIHRLKYAKRNWWQVFLFYEQLNGLYNGYQHCKSKDDKNITFSDFVYMNSIGDTYDLHQKFNETNGTVNYQGSAIVKLLPGNEDLFVAHATWRSYNYLVRVLKNYIFQYHISSVSSEPVPGSRITFSGYPGVLYSTDDFYLISSQLVVTQTWIRNNKTKLWNNVKPAGRFLAGPRIMAANRLAKNNDEWRKHLAYKNSGTFNNQWLVVDYNNYVPSGPLTNGTFSVIEQIPGKVSSVDLSFELIQNGHFASHNLPVIKQTLDEIDKVNVTDKNLEYFFSHDTNPIIKMVESRHDLVNSSSSMMDLITYNDYQVDEYSECECTPPYSASIAVAGRNDLNSQLETYPADLSDLLKYQLSGAIDGKVTGYKLVKSLKFLAINGPPIGRDLPPFSWNSSETKNSSDIKNLPHEGQPDKFEFKPITTTWLYKTSEPHYRRQKANNLHYINRYNNIENPHNGYKYLFECLGKSICRNDIPKSGNSNSNKNTKNIVSTPIKTPNNRKLDIFTIKT